MELSVSDIKLLGRKVTVSNAGEKLAVTLVCERDVAAQADSRWIVLSFR